MSEILGIVDAIEAAIMEGKRLPFTDKVVLHEGQLLILIDKLRIVAKNDTNTVRKAVEVGGLPEEDTTKISHGLSHSPDLSKAHADALRIREDAAIYADNVLAHLQLLVTKMQKNIIKLEQNLESGRSMMDRIADTTPKDSPS
jgi:hypothetical protein